MTPRPQADGLGPTPSSLTLVTVQILVSLGRGPMHGYGIKLDIEERTDGAMTLGSGTLYQAMQRLEKQGLVQSSVAQEPGGRRGRVYELEPLGRDVLERELELMQRTVAFAAAGSESPA